MYTLWAKARRGPEIGNWVMCWWFDNLEFAIEFSRQRIWDVPFNQIMIKDKNDKVIQIVEK